MNLFDSGILYFLNGFVQKSHAVDRLIMFVNDTETLKGGFVFALVWWAWFSRKKENRETLIMTMIGGMLSLFVARALAESLPFRARPMADPNVHIQFVEGARKSVVAWSSFPSDHAALFFSLATGLLLVSRPLGLIALAHAFFIISLPRIYLGIHYPTDIVVGAAIGIATTYIVCRANFKEFALRPCRRWMEVHESSFYAFFTSFAFQVMTLFQFVRDVAKLAKNWLMG